MNLECRTRMSELERNVTVCGVCGTAAATYTIHTTVLDMPHLVDVHVHFTSAVNWVLAKIHSALFVDAHIPISIWYYLYFTSSTCLSYGQTDARAYD